MAFPNVRAYDPAYAYEYAVLMIDALKRLYQDGETAIYYITCGNENYVHPGMPEGAENGIIRGMYKLQSSQVSSPKAGIRLLGSGAILRMTLQAQQILAEKYQIASDVYSVTSYTELRREAQTCQRWNMLHPTAPPKVSYLEEQFAGYDGLTLAASDNVRAVTEQIQPWVPGDFYVLGTDGMGRSETREALRRHFEVDAESIVIATLWRLSKAGVIAPSEVQKAIEELGVDADKQNPLYA
jgi:pyruvate dehydrogenase E1 component